MKARASATSGCSSWNDRWSAGYHMMSWGLTRATVRNQGVVPVPRSLIQSTAWSVMTGSKYRPVQALPVNWRSSPCQSR